MLAKWGNVDRRRVVDEIERRQQITLHQVGSRNVWQKDDAGREYVILGGKKAWHGIPEDIIRAERNAHQEARFVVCELTETKIRVFEGDLHHLIKNAHRLRQRERSFQFNVFPRGDRLGVQELPGFYLDFQFDIPYTEAGRSIQRVIDPLSDEQRKRLVASLTEDQS